jgi:hypothetical protein
LLRRERPRTQNRREDTAAQLCPPGHSQQQQQQPFEKQENPQGRDDDKMLFSTNRMRAARGISVLALLALAPPHASGNGKGGGDPGGGNPGGIKTCDEQEPCLKWVVSKLSGAASDNCGIEAANCPIKICMVLDTDAPNCTKNGGTVSHTCDNANSLGCVRSAAWIQNSGGVDGPGGTGNCNPTGATAWEEKCDTVPDEVRLCQIGKPGDVLFWIVYVCKGVVDRFFLDRSIDRSLAPSLKSLAGLHCHRHTLTTNGFSFLAVRFPAFFLNRAGFHLARERAARMEKTPRAIRSPDSTTK